ncbi:MAG: pseudouridine-5'-phosphate glycosidase [Gemmatimonadaceae bacterium]|nr:pseudouridine-5'-phosphate glycosidase [Gemmatimonadaceae bacterium]
MSAHLPGTVVLRGTALAAQRDGTPLVALESSVLAQGLPIPENAEADRRMRAAVRAGGAEPAMAAVVRGVPLLGLEGADLQRFLARDGVGKVSTRDIAWAVTEGKDGATTVAATLACCRAVGVRVFATGGIGGVHREAPFDESADLVELSRSSVITVCAGAKSILDLPATLERLETLGVPVIGFETEEFPGFFTERTGLTLTQHTRDPAAIARAFLAHRALGARSGMLVVQPPPAAAALDRTLVDAAVSTALHEARPAGIRGPRITPFLLAAVERATAGRSLATNLALLEANAALAARIAVALHAIDPAHPLGAVPPAL